MLVAVVPVDRIRVARIGINVPDGTPTKVIVSPPRVTTERFPAPPTQMARETCG
jgi:hypothetical protein